MNIDVDEQYDRYILFTLDKIEKELRRLDDNSSVIRYSILFYPRENTIFIPPLGEEQHLIQKLEKMGLYKILGIPDEFEVGTDQSDKLYRKGITFTLNLNLDKFNEAYKEYRAKVKRWTTTQSARDNSIGRYKLRQLFKSRSKGLKVSGKSLDLFNILLDFEPHESKELNRGVSSLNLKSLISKLNKKISKIGFTIALYTKGVGNFTTQYILKHNPE